MLSIFTDIDPSNVCGFKCVNVVSDSETISISPSELKNIESLQDQTLRQVPFDIRMKSKTQM